MLNWKIFSYLKKQSIDFSNEKSIQNFSPEDPCNAYHTDTVQYFSCILMLITYIKNMVYYVNLISIFFISFKVFL